MLELAPGWKMEVERGPECLFVRLYGQHNFDETKKGVDATKQGIDETKQGKDRGSSGHFELANHLWELLKQHFTYRLVLESEDLPPLKSYLIGQLVLLHKRVCTQGGMMRFSGLSDENQQILHASGLATRFPSYRNREEAVMGYRPKRPR